MIAIYSQGGSYYVLHNCFILLQCGFIHSFSYGTSRDILKYKYIIALSAEGLGSFQSNRFYAFLKTIPGQLLRNIHSLVQTVSKNDIMFSVRS